MKTNLLSLSLGVLSLSTLATLSTACASSAASDASLGSTTSVASASQGGPAADLSGTWAFVLASSDVSTAIRERCAKSSGNDVAKADACWNEAATDAANEKIRFRKETAGHTVWTSFGSSEPERSKEIVFVEVPVEIAADGPGRLLMKVAGAPKGDHAAQFAKSSTNVMRIDVIDARTIAMIDPKKGRLVFSKE